MRFSVDILKAITDASNPHFIVVDLAANVTPVLSYVNLSRPSSLSAGWGTPAITCSTGASIASLGITSIALEFW